MSKKKHANDYMEDPTLLIYNTDNYNQYIVNSFEEILTKLEHLIIEYVSLFIEKIKINNRNNWNYIFEKGFETILHSFKIIYYYTKNLDLTYYNCQKSYYTYIEFISQTHDSNHAYLKLTTRDAVIYSYKQTIYNFNDDYRIKIGNSTNNEKSMLKKIDFICSTIKDVMSYLIFNVDINHLLDKEYVGYNYSLIKQALTNKLNEDHYETVKLFVTLLTNKHTEISEFINLLNEFIIKIQHKKYSSLIEKINNNIFYFDADIIELDTIFN